MQDLLMNPWTITVVGGVLVFLISRWVKLKRKKSRDREEREHRINIGKRGRVQSGGDVVAGDKGGTPHGGKPNREHKITIEDDGEIVSDGDAVAGDLRDTAGDK